MNLNRIVEIGFALFNPSEHPVRSFHLSAITNKNRILVLATNSPKTHSRNLFNPKYGHAGNNIAQIKGSCSELRAVMQLKNKMNISSSRCNLINIRINRNGQLANSCPCESCKSLLSYFAFKSVVFTNDSGQFQIYS